MVTWEVLDAQFDDETRQAKDLSNLNSVFEVVKLAVLEPDEEIEKFPKLVGSSYKGLIAVSIGPMVVVFGEDGSNLLLQLMLEECIDALVWLPCGEFLLLADCLGYLHCIHISSQSLLFSRSFPIRRMGNDNCSFIDGISYLEMNNKAVVVLVTKCGQIVMISDIDTKSLICGANSKDVALLTSIKCQLCITVTEIFDREVLISCASFHNELDIPRAKLWAATEEGIICWQSHSSTSRQSDSFLFSSMTNCSKVVILQKGRYIAALNREGEISVYCTETGILLWKTPLDLFKEHIILDFRELSCENKCSQLLTLVGSSDEKSSHFLCLMTFPGFLLKHELSVTQETFLVNLVGGVESSFFIEGKRIFDGTIESLNLKNIVDGLPETRLTKLLRSRKFVEAESFCGTFSLDVSEVYKANATYLCDCVNPWRTSNGNTISEESISRSYEELIEILEKIVDLEYVTSICIEAAMPYIIIAKQLLSYGKKRIATDIQAQSDDHLKSLMHKISENLYHLCTYEMIYSDSSIHQWFEFCRKNILDEFFTHLVKGDLNVARTIWHRHQYKFYKQIDKTCVEKILESIPCNLPSEVVFSWLQNHILNDLLRLCPASMEAIAFWIDRKLKTIEFHEKEMWPTKALNLAQNVISLLNNASSYFATGGDIEVEIALYAAHEKAHSSTSSLYQLRRTVLALQDLKVLAAKFRLKIKFCQYTQESKYCVVKSLLDMLVCGEEVAPLFNNFLQEYMRQHDLKCDQILAQYISDTLSSYGQVWWMWELAPWENKLYAVIPLIVDVQVKSECILLCIQSASVPWSKGTTEVCKLGVSLNTTLRSHLESQSKLSNLKVVLRKYNIHKMNFANGRNFELILRSVSQKENDDSITNALTVVDAFGSLKKKDAYFFKLCSFMKVGKFEEGVNLFKSIEKKSDKLELFAMFQNYVIQQLNVPPITIECKTKLKRYTSAILLLEPFIMTCLRSDQITDLHIIRRLRNLQKYHIYLSIGKLEQKPICIQVLEEFIWRTYEENQTKSKIDTNACRNSLATDSSHPSHDIGLSKSHSSMKENETNLLCGLEKVLRVAHLLDIKKKDLFTLLFNMALRQGESKMAIEFANRLTEDSKVHNCPSVIYDIIEKNANFWMTTDVRNSNSGQDSLFHQIDCQMKKLYSIITSALYSCSNESLAQLTNLALWCFYGIELLSRCLLSKEYTTNKNNETDDHLFEWNFTSMFKDISVPIEPEYVLPTISRILILSCNMYKTNITMPFFNNEELNFSSENEIMQCLDQLGSHLQDRNQDLMYVTLSFTLSFYKFNLECNVNTISGILHKRILSKKQDVAYTLSLLTVLRPRESLKVIDEVIKKVGCDYSYLLTFANVGIDLCQLLDLKEICVQLRDLARKATWGLKFEKLGLSFMSYFTEEKKALKKGLKALAQHEDCNLNIMAEFSHDFRMDITEVYLCYLKALIRSWNPTLREGSSEEVLILPYKLLHKSQGIICKINNKCQLKDMLNKELIKLCPYNYEVIEIVISQLYIFESNHNDMLKTGRDVICFLKAYKRHSPPSPLEIEEYLKTHPERRELPQIAKYRLPFHLLYSKPLQTKLIELELNATNYQQWIGMATFLTLKVEQVFYFAAINTLSQTFKNKCHPNKRLWEIGSIHSSALTTIHEIIWKIPHPDLAMACGHCVVQNLPYSLDKVLAVQNCIRVASYWIENSSSGQAIAVFQKFSSMYRELAIEYSLYKYNLAEPELIALTNDPCYLVNKLYENPKLASITALSTRSIPDINSCVTEICEISKENQIFLQFKLLQKWLPLSVDRTDDLEETVSNFKLVLDTNIIADDCQSKEERVSRTVYLLRNFPKEESIAYLLRIAHCKESTDCIENRLNSLRCLLAIADEEALMEHGQQGIEEIRYMLQSVTYVSRLEEVGYAITVTYFESIDKTALVEGLWHSLKHAPKPLMLIVDICLNFKVNSTRFWGVLLEQVTKYVEDKLLASSWLQRVLLQIKLLPHLWVLPQLTAAWTRLLTGILSSMVTPVREDDLQSCIHAVNLLTHHCPVEIQTEKLIETCIALELPVLAAVMAANDSTNNNSIQETLCKFENKDILLNYERVEKTLMIQRNVEVYLQKLKMDAAG